MTRSPGWSSGGRCSLTRTRATGRPADTVKERAQLEEMYYRGNCPWMVWDPERSGRRGPPRPGRLADPDPGARCWRCASPAGTRRCRCSRSARTPTTSRSRRAALLLSLAARHLACGCGTWCMTGTAERQQEARAAARAFTPGADLDSRRCTTCPRDGCPRSGGRSRRSSRRWRGRFAPTSSSRRRAADAHQDHRTIGEIVPTAFRDQLCLGYEIPKWDGDLARPNVYFPLTDDVARRKVELLDKCYPSQRGRDWWGEETFLGLARLRGMECRARYAEAFTCSKLVIS